MGKPPTEKASSQVLATADHHPATEMSFRAQMGKAIGINPALCYQCGKCTAGCPMASEMDLKTHEMVRMVQMDRRDALLNSESIWLCLTCETCTTRCPNGFDPAGLIDAARELAARENPSQIPRKIRAFHQCFLDQIHAHGRIFEFGLVAAYKLRSGAFFDDITSAPAMIARGKLAFSPRNIDGVGDVRRIFDACLSATAEEDQ